MVEESEIFARDVAEELVDFLLELEYLELPASTIDRALVSVLDVLASGLAGITAEGIEPLRSLTQEIGGKPEARIWGAPAKVPLSAAIMVNTSMARALEFDDVHEMAMVHPGVACIPTALALAESIGGVSGEAFLGAIIAGMEIVCRLGKAPTYHIAGDLHKGRWMSFTYQAGYFGAAAVASKLLGLSRSETLDAFGNAYSQLAGNQQAIQEGALIVRVQQGITAWGGVLSALLAQRGVNGAHRVFEGKFGYFNALYSGDYDRSALTNGLGKIYEVDNVSVKPYPCCKINHVPIAGALDLMRRYSLQATDIESILVHVNSRETWDQCCQPLDTKRRPTSSVEAQFSLPYCVAAAVVRDGFTLGELVQTSLEDPMIRSVSDRVIPVIDMGSDVSGGRVLPTPVVIDVCTTAGKTLSGSYRYAPGHPRSPLTWDDVVAKFEACTRSVFPEVPAGVVHNIASCVSAIPDLSNVTVLLERVCSLGAAGI